MQYTYTQSGKVGTLSYQEKGGDICTYSYTYDKDEKPTKAVYPDKSYTTWTYDSLRRNTKAVYSPTEKAKDAAKLYTVKTYKDSRLPDSGATKNATTAFVSSYTNRFGSSGAAVSSYSYTYDNWGNIRAIADGNGKVRIYTYNDYGEVIRAEEAYADGTAAVYEYTYDAGGNITEEKVKRGTAHYENVVSIASNTEAGLANNKQLCFDTAEISVNTYGYANVWKDQLTSYRIGDTTYNISYDGAGNPISYMGASLTWNETGNLTSIQTGASPYMTSGVNQAATDQTIAYTYLSDGTRRTKTVNGRTTTYHYNNGLLLSEITVSAGTANGNDSTSSNVGSNANSSDAETLSYYYGSTGKLAFVTYRKGNNTPVSYFYAYNGQGDVIALCRSSDSVLIGTYEYDLWGRPVSVKEATAGIDINGILTKNPFRYRGYYYDEETGFYYLNARYHDSAYAESKSTSSTCLACARMIP